MRPGAGATKDGARERPNVVGGLALAVSVIAVSISATSYFWQQRSFERTLRNDARQALVERRIDDYRDFAAAGNQCLADLDTKLRALPPLSDLMTTIARPATGATTSPVCPAVTAAVDRLRIGSSDLALTSAESAEANLERAVVTMVIDYQAAGCVWPLPTGAMTLSPTAREPFDADLARFREVANADLIGEAAEEGLEQRVLAANKRALQAQQDFGKEVAKISDRSRGGVPAAASARWTGFDGRR